MKSLAYI